MSTCLIESLRENTREMQRKAKRAWHHYELLGDKSTRYARGMRKLAEIYDGVHLTFATALEEALTPTAPGEGEVK